LLTTTGNALAIVSRATATHANGVYLIDIFGTGENSRHRAEGFAPEVLIETSDDHPDTGIGKIIHQIHQAIIEELSFVDPHHLHTKNQSLSHFVAASYRSGLKFPIVSRDNPTPARSGVRSGLEHLHSLPCDDRPPQTANKFFALAGEHATGNHLDMSVGSLVHRHLCSLEADL
jgi:hypothetical protein